MKTRFNRLLALVLSAAMALQLGAITIFADTITAFTALNPAVATQTVANGTAWGDLTLPTSLALTSDGVLTDIPVTEWVSSPAYDPSPAVETTYTLTPTPDLSGGHTVD
ncbi:MAG: hypothetical protein ACERKO_09530, partial [Acetanaerobacterium sp.]